MTKFIPATPQNTNTNTVANTNKLTPRTLVGRGSVNTQKHWGGQVLGPQEDTTEVGWIRCKMYYPDTRTCCHCKKTIRVGGVSLYVDYLALDSDDEGYHWRAFCPTCYESLKGAEDLMSLYESYK